MKITVELLEMGRSEKGGFSKDQIELLGMNWQEFQRIPKHKTEWFEPKSNWMDRVVGMEISEEAAARFIHLGGLSKYQRKKLALSSNSESDPAD